MNIYYFGNYKVTVYCWNKYFPTCYRPKQYWKYQYYQPDTDKDCGLKIANASRYDNGVWKPVYSQSKEEIFVYVKGNTY